MVREYVESAIRDGLAEDLSIISAELKLVQKEYYLPNVFGTRGFVDILAKDSRNRYVIIEIKRSKEASREALHEILKYVEALKENKSVNESEIRVMVISTDWKELLVPFSSFAVRISFFIEGFHLNVDNEFNFISCEKICTLPLKGDRLFSPVHNICYYLDKSSLKQGIESHVEVFREKGISDYVLILLTAPEDLKDKASTWFVETLAKIYDFCEFSVSDDVNDIEVPHYPYLIYSAFTRRLESNYLALISKQGYFILKGSQVW